MNWYWVIHSKTWGIRFSKVAARMFPRDPLLAERAALWAQERLFERLRVLPSAPSEPYILSAFLRLLVDFSRAEFGYRRPPTWVKRMGTLWVEVFQWLCIRRRHPEEILGLLAGQSELGEDLEQVLEDRVWEAIRVIQSKISDCLERISLISTASFQETDSPPPEKDLPNREGATDEHVERETLEILWEVLHDLLEGATGTPATGHAMPSERLLLNLEQARQRLTLTDDERLILRMLFQDDLPLAQVARALGKPEHQVRRIQKQVLARLRDILMEAGLTVEDLSLRQVVV